MADKSPIEWTDASWNPVVGCSIFSPGCAHCYAMRQAARIEAMADGDTHYAGTTKKVKGKARGGEAEGRTGTGKSVWTGKLALAPEHILTQPLRWSRPRRIFVNSMGDLFHEDVPDDWIDQVFAVMALAPQHTFQLLTKRSARMREYLTAPKVAARIASDGLHEATMSYPSRRPLVFNATWPLPNVWLGVSAERQQEADERILDLLAAPAAIRFASAEPLLGPINFRRIRISPNHHTIIDALDGYMKADKIGHKRTMLDWIIAGGESGPDARPMHPDWPRQIRDQCAAAGTAFFFKQWGEFRPLGKAEHGQACGATLIGTDPYDGEAYVLRVGKRRAGRLLDGVEHNAMPEARLW